MTGDSFHPAMPGSPKMSVPAGSVAEVFATFLKLGLTSFGGPLAHFGYFRMELVERRRWVTEAQFAHLLALCQFLPGPASSQLGFSLGMARAGWAGGAAAFVAFTLPSVLLMVGFAVFFESLSGGIGAASLHGLKLVALVVVAHGTVGMARQLCPDATRRLLAVAAAGAMIWSGTAWMQMVVVAAGALAGWRMCREVKPIAGDFLPLPHGARFGRFLLVIFGLLLVGSSFAAHGRDGLAAMAGSFFRAGSLVFGGGHVVLPLLEQSVVHPGGIARGEFLAAYGAAQAVPGPMFSLAAFLGARLGGPDASLTGAAVATVMIFLPGFLLVAGVLPVWTRVAANPWAARAVAGIHAAVVGLLAAALYHPIFTSAVRGPSDVAIAMVGYLLLASGRISPLLLVVGCVAAAGLTG